MRTLISICFLYLSQNFLSAQCGPCPLPFTQELLQAELPAFICEAANDFENIPKRMSSNEDGLVIWETRTRVPGALDNFFAFDSLAADTKGKDFVAMYVCQEYSDPVSMTPMFEAFRQAINLLEIDCVTLEEGAVLENASADNLRAVTWMGEMESAVFGKSMLKLELDLNYLGQDYFLVLHVSLMK